MNFIRENAKRETRKLFSRSRFKKSEVKSRFIFQVSRFKNANRETRKLISNFYIFLYFRVSIFFFAFL